MNTESSRQVSCHNEGCPRPAEPGERYCPTCGLERSLFHRDARFASARARTEREAGERRR